MRSDPQLLTSWKVVEGNGFIQPDPSTGFHRCAGGVRIVQTSDHPPVDAEMLGFGEVEVLCDVAGDLRLWWEPERSTWKGPLAMPIGAGIQTTARFPLYAESSWSGRIKWIRLGLPDGGREAHVGCFRLLGFSNLPPHELQQFARARASMEIVNERDLKITLLYNGTYLAPLETKKWIQVSLRDRNNREILSITRPAQGNYDAPWIEVVFLIPAGRMGPQSWVENVAWAEVVLLDNQTGHSLSCSAGKR